MIEEAIKDVLDKHIKWCNGKTGGERANLYGANLKGANLEGANLKGAYLKGAYLEGAYLEGANLEGANLYGDNLKGANLKGAYLKGANLKGANLEGANLKGAYLEGANLYGAYLEGANLYGAYLEGALLEHAKISDHFVCPDTGAFTAWKKGASGCLIKLQIPEDAERMTSLVGRKCRASKAFVLQIWDSAGNEIEECGGWLQGDFIYRVGEMAIPDKYDPDIRVECSHGIHFFVTRKEAGEWR